MNLVPSRSRQISLSAMLVVMLIFTVMSAGLFYASRVEAIQDELAIFFGSRGGSTAGTNRRSHLIFLLFTYTSPLLLAGVLSTVHSLMNRKR